MSQLIEHFDQLASLAQEEPSADRHMDIWVRGEEVSVYEVEMPDVPQRKWVEMVPWLLEDQLLRPAEELHFVVGPVQEANRALVYVVAKESINRWLMMAKSKSVSVQKFCPDYLALPMEDGYWTMSIQGSRMLVRTGSHTGFASDVLMGWQLLDIELGRGDDIRVAAVVDDESAIPDEWHDRINAQKGLINWSFVDLPDVNLLSGEYRPKKAAELRPWLPSIGLAACALVLAMFYMLIQSYHWQKDMVVLDAGVAAAYEDLFGEAWRGPSSAVRGAAEEKIRLLEHQFVSLASTPLYELRSVDPGLSGCSDCDVQTIKQEEDSVSFTLKPADGLQTQMRSLRGVSLGWGDPDEDGVLSLTVSREANDG